MDHKKCVVQVNCCYSGIGIFRSYTVSSI